MRKSLEQTITGVYRDIAKEQIKQEGTEDVSEQEQTELKAVLNWHLRDKANQRASEKTGNKHLGRTENNQRRILQIQKKKQELVQQLEQERKNLNNPDYYSKKPAGSREVRYDSGRYHVEGTDGQLAEITLGELITDYELGIEYYLDPESVPKAVRKKYAFEKTKRELQGLLDEQIVLDELSRGRSEAGAPLEIKKKIIKTGELQTSAHEGFVAEIMVSNFLEKLAYDCGADFQLVRTDIYEDVAHKIDFAIRRRRHYRGVKVEDQSSSGEESSQRSELGVQFTISQTNYNLKKKQEQIEKMREKIGGEIELDDIVLVQVPLKSLGGMYTDWVAAGRPSGGPDKLWDVATRQAIAEGVLRGLLTSEEIGEIKSRIE